MAADASRLALIVKLIDLSRADLVGTDQAAFERDQRLIDATAHRVMHIGENAMRLGVAIRARHSELPWREIAGMRNFIAHEYQNTSVPLLWRTVHGHLDGLRAMCVAELAGNIGDIGE